MANRNPKTGGTPFVDGEVLHDYDLNDTIAATTYHKIAENLISVSVSTSVAGTFSDTMTISIPPNSCTKFIEIKARISGFSDSHNDSGNTARTSSDFRLYKVYNTVETDLIPLSTLTYSYAYTSGGDGGGTKDANTENVSFYYEPTEDEKINGFDIKIYISVSKNDTAGGGDASATIHYCYIMGI